ncbi:(d)CMP kinase [bacterium]|nr:(d)CMP kinase [bacterium]
MVIDGPAASGKSTTARRAAKELAWLYMDTGAMYRAITVKVLRLDIGLDDKDTIATLAENIDIKLEPVEDGVRVYLDGDEISEEIRTPEVDKAVGPICEIARVRECMVDLQRQLGSAGNVVAEGRDMGTIVFPDAPLKFYMNASIEARAERRRIDQEKKGIKVDLEALKADIAARDYRDSNREHSPLMAAEGAIHVDTTDLTIEAQVAFIVGQVRALESDQKN